MKGLKSLIAAQSALAVLWVSSPALGAQLVSYCTLRADGTSTEVEGMGTEIRLPVASVSKIMTAWWAAGEKGLDYRYPTLLHVTPSADGEHVHIEGSGDPYFSKESLHFALSELERLGVSKVERLTFDENFKFHWFVNSSKLTGSSLPLQFPTPTDVQRYLRGVKPLTKGWATSVATMARHGIKIVAKPSITVKTIQYLRRSEFVPSPGTRSYTMRSSGLESLLKEMNRNSNNYTANVIFENLGGASRFQQALARALQLTEDDVHMINGAGSPLELPGGRTYNEAKCSSVLMILRDFRRKLAVQGKDLRHVMPVAGHDTTSTLGSYTNDVTTGALVAKTGTINAHITLAGIIHTQSGDYLFMYNVAVSGSETDQRRARALIRLKVTELVRHYQGPNPLAKVDVTFLSVDRDSALTTDGGGMP